MPVFVLDKRKTPLMPCSEKRARLLLSRGRARVHRMYPFTIRLIDRQAEASAFQPVQVKLDPGSVTTGLSLNREDPHNSNSQTVLHLAEITHRGKAISKKLQARSALRRGRRSRRTRYRAPRFDNRTRPQGWLPPSLEHRVLTTMSAVTRYRRIAPITSITVERVRFDMQVMENADISGKDYQQGTLYGYEVREYVLERDGRACAYCDAADVPLNLDHVIPKSRGGSDRPSNLTCACIPCNQRKDCMPVEQFLAKSPVRLAAVLKRLKRPLRDAAAVNATRWELWRRLKATGLPVEASSGGRTKWNRHRLGVPKGHALDAACTGSIDSITGWSMPMLAIRCSGRGSHARTKTDAHGFARLRLPRVKAVRGFRTGDLVMATVIKGKKLGVHIGRVAVRGSGRFNIQTHAGTVQGISWKRCKVIQRDDGYAYANIPSTPQDRKGGIPPNPMNGVGVLLSTL